MPRAPPVTTQLVGAEVLDMAGVNQNPPNPPRVPEGRTYRFEMNPAPDPRVAPVEGNMAAFHRVLTTLPMLTVDARPDVTAFRSGLPHPLFNGVIGACFAPGTEEVRVRETVAPFLEQELPFLWWGSPSTWSPALDRALLAAGLLREDSPGMHRELTSTPEVPEVPGLEIALGADAATPDVARLMCEGFDIPAPLSGPIGDLLAIFDPARLVNAVATLDGEQVGCGSLWITGTTAGLYNIATLEPARGRGVGYAVTAALLAEGRTRGCTESILHASPLGLPVYQRLGFVEVCRMPQYVWAPGF